MNIGNFKTTALVAVVILAIVSVFSYLMKSSNGDGSLIIKAGDNEIKMGFSGNKLELTELLIRLSQDFQQWKETKAILRESYGLYEIDGSYLIDRLRKEQGDTSTAVAMRELLSDLKGPFQREFHKFYDVTHLEFVTAINSLEYDHTVAKELRRLRDRATGIFEERGVEVEVSFLTQGGFNDGHAVLCNGSQYRGLDLLLLNPSDLQKIIRVIALDTSLCIKPPNGEVVDLERVQIKPTDGRKLFGNVPLDDKARAILYPVPNGYTVKPSSAINMEVATTNLKEVM